MSTIPKAVEENIKLCYDISNDKLSPVTREVFYAKIKETGEYYMPTNYDCFVAGYRTYQLATDGLEELEKGLATLKTPIGSDEYWNKLDQNFGKTQEYHYKGEKCVAGCKNFSHYETKHHPDCPFYKNSLSKSTDDQITALQSKCTEKDQEIERLKDECEIKMTATIKATKDYLKSREKDLEELKAENERLKETFLCPHCGQLTNHP